MKKYCPTHHLYYTGNECPLCASERTEALARKFYKEPISQPKEEVQEITQYQLEMLAAKFNKH